MLYLVVEVGSFGGISVSAESQIGYLLGIEKYIVCILNM